MSKYNLLKVLSAVAILAMVFSNLQAPLAQAQGGDGLKRQTNGQSHRVSFVTPSNGKFLPAAQALGTSKRPQDPGMALAKKYAHEFGLNHPEKDLSVKKQHENNGRSTVHYQQKYNDVPVMGGELIVNTDEAGDLYSINGEVSPDLSLDTNPTIDAEQAKATALGAMAKWYEKTPEDFAATEPELWIFDESLLQPSTRPVELVWRMEVTPKDQSMPVRELVLVNAQRGVISFHFNQVDTAWDGSHVNSMAPFQAAEAAVDLVPTWYVATTGNDTYDCLTPSTPCATINAAIGKATAGDTVKVAVGTYTGSGNEVVLINKNITLSGGWDAAFSAQTGMSTIDGEAARRGVTQSQGTASIERFTIQNGYHDYQGGGIRNSGTLTLSNGIVTRNISHGTGGGIDNYGTLTVNNTSIIENRGGSSTGSGDRGGGGILNLSGTLTLNNSSVSKNTMIGSHLGSGIYSEMGTVILNNSTVSENSGGGGEGIYGYWATINLNNSTISGNESYGFENVQSNVTLKNTLISGNGGSSDCYNNTGEYSGTVTSQGYNLITNPLGCTFTPVAGDKINVSAQLGTLIGFPGYVPLLAGSPAIDAGNPATPGSGGGSCLADDERGVSRPVAARCDIGAYEYTVPGSIANLFVFTGNNQKTGPNTAFLDPLKVTALDSQGSPVPNVKVTFVAPESGPSGMFIATNMRTMDAFSNSGGIATTSTFIANGLMGSYTVTASTDGVAPVNFNLQHAAWYVATTGDNANDCATPLTPCATINAAIAKVASGSIILIAAGNYTGSGTEVVLINKDVNLYGGWNTDFTAQTGTSTVDGQRARQGIDVMGGAVARIDHFTVQNGSACGGGGIHVAGGETALTLDNSIVTDNGSTCTGAGSGIYSNGKVILNNSTVKNNTYQGIRNAGRLLILNNSTVSNNTCSCFGAGIGTDMGVTELNNSTVSGNVTRYNGGGGIYNHGTLRLNNSTISRNEIISGEGGGLMSDGSVTIQNSILALNTAPSGPDCSGTHFGNGTINSLGYNFIGNNSGCTFTAATGDQVGTSARPISPHLAPLQSNGGATWTHALAEGSLAIDAGNPATCLPTDQRGVARPVGSACDIGAYEGSVPWVPAALLKTYTAEHMYGLPGKFLCDQTKQTCTSDDPHANAAHKYAIGMYNFYVTKHNRDSIDNAGMVIQSSVRYCPPDQRGYPVCPYDNAFWDGEQMIYGDAHRWPMADDIVAHELTHGVTEYESNLFYYYQSGAISESLSDLWGEYYDQTNGQGNDSREMRWLIGEDLTTNASFIIRSMSNPPAYGDPDKMSSPLYQKLPYYDGWWDDGGVHSNSGINNKAVYLMVDGGTFNGKSVAPLGWDKTAAIYYEVNTNLLSSGADYSDLYYAVQQACVSLVGEKGITAADCAEVKNALDAVEMGKSLGSFNNEAPVCDSGKVANAFFTEDFENGLGNWTINNGSYTRWQYDSPWGQYAQTNDHFLYGDDAPQDGNPTDARARLVAFTVPANAYLRFAHAYEFEFEPGVNYDGGVMEYSVNNGSTWVDAGSLIVNNGYKGTVTTTSNSPLKGKLAFVGSSHGYTSTRLNLSTLAGKTVSFRWRMGLDAYVSVWGWWLDNIQAYTCGATATISGNAGAPNVLLSYVDGTTKTVLSKADGSYSIRVPSGWSGDITPSLACYSFDPPFQSYSDLTGALTSNYAAAVSGTASCSDIHVEIAGVDQGRFGIAFGENLRKSFSGLNNGPAVVVSKNDLPLVASQGVIFSGKSYSEMMGLPIEQLSQEYWFPSYNNVDLNSQLRVSNLGTVSTTISVYLGTTKIDQYTLSAGGATRKNYATRNGGPLRVTSSATKILSTIRLLYNNISLSELMGLPKEQLTTSYLFPYYNNVAMTSNLQVSNVGTTSTTIKVYLGSSTTPIDTFSLPAKSTQSRNYVGKNSGPLKVTSSVSSIVPSLRVLYVGQSYSEMMGYPANQLAKEYWYPAYDNNMLDSQVRVSNVGSGTTTITVYLGNTQIDSYNLAAGAATRKNYAKNVGALHIVSSSESILTTIRMLYNTPGFSSFYEMMGMPSTNLSTQYIFPWYNNVAMNSEIRFAAP